LVIAQEGPGKGRVVVFSYNTGWQGSGGFQCGITPWMEPPDTHAKYWEYHLSMVIRAVLWAARKEPGIALKEIKIDNAETPKIVLDLRNPGDPLSVSAQVTVNDPLGEQVAQFTKDASLKAGDNALVLDLPDNLPGGKNVVDVILKNNGKVMNWGSVSWTVDRGVALSNVAFDKRAYYPGETARASVELTVEGGEERDVLLQAEFSDSLGRLLGRQEKAIKVTGKGAAEFSFDIGDPLSTHGTVRVRASADGKALAVAEGDFIMFTEQFAGRGWGDWQSCIWGSPVGAYERPYLAKTYIKLFKDYGINTVLASANWPYDREYAAAVRAGFQIMPMSVAFGFINVGHRVPKGKLKFAEARKQYQKTKDKKYLVRPICLNDPKDLEPLAEKLRTVAEYAGWLEPIGYNLGDEMSLTYYVTPFDYDFNPVCLNCFRDWLKGRYGALDALNKEWGTDFGAWEKVMPMPADEVKERKNYAPWADHREFMDITFAKFFGWLRERLREKDPKATVGMSGSQAAEAYGGYNWRRLMQTLDFIQNYTHRDSIIMQRSFDGRVPRAPWYGYKVRNPAMRYFLWWCLLNGSRGGSYFVDNYMFRPDMLPTESTKEAGEVIREFQGGIAKLLRNTKRINDIGLLYSQPSIRGAFISGVDALFRENRHGWVKCLEDLGFQCEFIAGPDLAAGKLSEKNYRALILPYAVALSAEEAKALVKYVEDGGFLIADAKVGLMNEHCRTLGQGMLDDLFGVRHDPADPLCSAQPGEAHFSRDMGKCTLKGLSLDVDCPVGALKLNGGTALGRHGETPIAIVNKKGKGMAVLLNLFLDTYPRRRELGIEGATMQLVSNLLRLRGIEPQVRVKTTAKQKTRFYTVRYQDGPALYTAVLFEVNRRAEKVEDRSVQIDVTFPKKGHIYDVRTGKFVGSGESASRQLSAGDVALYAILPYCVKGVSVAPTKPSVRAGDRLEYTVSVQTDGATPAGHVVRVEVVGPDGKSRAHYGAKLLAKGGRAKGGFPTALNDAPGEWTLRATDLVTRSTGSATFRCVRAEGR
ncbi:MAG: hypothetical protein GXP25_11445, partial [Planctomycetes bacterium]|nr:hypothetical protein [Planctomycetota bacterium]